MVSFGADEEEGKTMKQQQHDTAEDLENPRTSLGGETNITAEEEEEDESTIVEENPDKYASLNDNKCCCGFWIVSFVLIMIFSRHLVHSFF